MQTSDNKLNKNILWPPKFINRQTAKVKSKALLIKINSVISLKGNKKIKFANPKVKRIELNRNNFNLFSLKILSRNTNS